MKNRAILTLVPAAALAIAGCGGYGAGASSTPAARPAASAARLGINHAGPHSYLTAGSGRAIYLFQRDRTSASTCYSACASIWPPVTTSAQPQAAPGVRGSELGTSRRTDAMTQVTYAGRPLYYYAGDSGPGQVTGQGLNQFGGRWYLLAPAGTVITSLGR